MAAAAWLALVVVLVGFLGAQHPVFDSVAVFRPQIIILLSVLATTALSVRAISAFVVSILAMVVCLIGLGPALFPGQTVANPFVIGYSHNLRFDNPRMDEVEAAIRRVDPDFVLLQEVSTTTSRAVDALADKFPTRIICQFRGEGGAIGGVAILTRLPALESAKCANGLGLGSLKVDTKAGPVTLVSVHLPWPWPYEQPEQMKYFVDRLSELSGPVVLAGDFNMAPWGESVARIAEVTHTSIASGLRMSFHRDLFWLGLPLDHVLVDRSMTAEVTLLDKFGSDHTAQSFRVKVQ